MRGAVMSCAQMAGSWPERLDHKTVAELNRAEGFGLNDLLGPWCECANSRPRADAECSKTSQKQNDRQPKQESVMDDRRLLFAHLIEEPELREVSEDQGRTAKQETAKECANRAAHVRRRSASRADVTQIRKDSYSGTSVDKRGEPEPLCRDCDQRTVGFQPVFGLHVCHQMGLIIKYCSILKRNPDHASTGC